MREHLTPAELSLWVAYGRQEGPWWGERGDYLAASVCQTVAASVGSGGRLGNYLVSWGSAEPVNLVPYNVGVAVLAAQFERLG